MSLKVSCGRDAARTDCGAVCQRTLACGHKCTKRCADPCSTDCKFKVQTSKLCPKGHPVKLPCSLSPTLTGNDGGNKLLVISWI